MPIGGGDKNALGKDAAQKKSALAPSIILAGKKSYGLRENVMFAVQGEMSSEPVLDCSSDGIR